MSFNPNASMRAILGLPEEETDPKLRKRARKTFEDNLEDDYYEAISGKMAI